LYEGGNIGELYARAKETAPGVFTYYNKTDYGDDSIGACNLTMSFTATGLTISSPQDDDQEDIECGFGAGVFADGSYNKTIKTKPEYFISGNGSKIYFKDTPPEKYQA
jgi:hypothetical protein